mgnify:CR=1 FL=1
MHLVHFICQDLILVHLRLPLELRRPRHQDHQPQDHQLQHLQTIIRIIMRLNIYVLQIPIVPALKHKE